MAVLNVRVQGKKCIFLRSPKSVEEDARVGFTPNGFRVVVDERRATVVTCAAPPTRRTRGLSSRFQKKQHWGLLFDDDATREVVPVTAPNIRTWIEEHVDGPWLVGSKVLVSDMVAGTVVSYNEDSRQGVVRYKLKKGKQKEVTKDTRFSVHDLLLAKCRWAAGTILLTTTNADGVMSTMECTFYRSTTNTGKRTKKRAQRAIWASSCRTMAGKYNRKNCTKWRNRFTGKRPWLAQRTDNCKT